MSAIRDLDLVRYSGTRGKRKERSLGTVEEVGVTSGASAGIERNVVVSESKQRLSIIFLLIRALTRLLGTGKYANGGSVVEKDIFTGNYVKSR